MLKFCNTRLGIRFKNIRIPPILIMKLPPKNRAALLGTLAALLLASAQVKATIFTFDARITSVTDVSGLYPYQVGDLFSVVLDYQPAGFPPDGSVDPTLGLYSFYDDGTGPFIPPLIRLIFGPGDAYSSVPDFDQGMEVRNRAAGDLVRVNGEGGGSSFLGFRLDDPTGGALNSDARPASYTLRNWASGGASLFTDGGDLIVVGEILGTRATLVPDATSTLRLLVLACGTLLWLGRRSTAGN